MCGISGIISSTVVNDIEFRINNMVKSIQHRGPDASGLKVIDSHIAFGHTRLSIIDLDSRANQPMISKNGNIIVYNGEIYNFKSIKEKLHYTFKTRSDTEVVLAAIEEKGIDWLLENSNGMFAFAYYEQNTGNTYIARDRMGIKPLYYYKDNNLTVFGSEIKCILNSGLVEAEFFEPAIDEYLANRYVRAPYTFFTNIYQVESGHYLKISDKNQLQDICYWTLPEEFNIDNNYDEGNIAEEFEYRIKDAIYKRMVSDVPLGTYLSGGVDSSLITAIVANKTNDLLNTYTIGFPELNEFEYADIVAQKYNTKHHSILMSSNNYFDLMDEIISFKDAPLGVPNEIPLSIMSRELKKEITVVLSGEGADELMGGYGRIFRSPFDFINTKATKQQTFYDYFINKYEYVPRSIRDKYLNKNFKLREEMDDMISSDFANRSNEENVFRFFHRYHVKGLLQRVDTTTMLASVEARVPFLDHELIEYTYRSVPYNLKLSWKDNNYKNKISGKGSDFYSEIYDTPKYLLRKVARKYLPDEIIDRKKVGFPVPLDMWIDTLAENGLELLKNASWIKPNMLIKLFEDCKENQRSGQLIWMFINIEMFRKQYFERTWKY